MSFDITVAGNKIPTDTASLKDFRADLNLAFSLDAMLRTILDTPLGKVPPNLETTSVAYSSGAQAWGPSGGAVRFGLQGGATGTLRIINSGPLVSYSDGLDQPVTKTITPPNTVSYVSLTLNFTISANASGNYSGGAYGVKAALDTADSYAIQFCKSFAPSTTVQAAIAETFESFVLPLHPNTLSLMSDGDYLLHEFDGNLHLSFGAYAGLDRVLYAGQSSVDVLQCFSSPLARIAAAAKTEAKLDAELDFKLSYASRFEALLTKTGGAAHLQLFRSAKRSTATTLQAGLIIETATSASVAAHTQQLRDSIIERAGGPGTAAGAAVGKVLSAGASALGDYATEATAKLTAWINKNDGLHANLQVAIETTKTRTILAGYTFDLNSAAFAKAWQAALDGDFLQALATGAVTLDTGSGLEQEYQRKTSVSCNLFNLWSLQTWDDFASKVSLVYAGSNVFHLLANIGRTLETKSVGSMHSLNFYFTADADVSGQSLVSHAEVDLHIDLTAQGDPKAAGTIATMLSAIEAGPVADALAHGMHTFAMNAKKGTAQLKITIPATAYAKINCDAYSNGKPATASSSNDMQNWNAFAQAADDLAGWPLTAYPALQKFTTWAELNRAANGAKAPNRTQVGEPFTQWPDDFPQVNGLGVRTLLISSMIAGQSFMNFCADLRDLIQVTDTKAAAITWERLIKLVTHAIEADVQIDFARPAALAIVRLCGTQGAIVSGPAIAPVDHFAVSIQLR